MDIKNLTKQQKILFGFLAIIVIFILLVILGVIPGLKKNSPGGSSTATVELEFWGIDKESVFSPLIEAYQASNSGVTINYVQVDPDEYEEKLIDALASRRGPDVLMIKHNWLPKHFEKLYPIPAASLSVKELKEAFVDVVADDMVYQQKIWGLPLWIDTLALYYNKDIFNSAGVAVPPTTWQEFQSISRSLTEKNVNGEIQRAGAAIGTSSNINNSADILSLLMLQTGSTITNGNGSAVFNDTLGKQAANFYTSFANPASLYYCWNGSLPESITAFAQGKVAMLLGYNSDKALIEAKNPYLNYGVVAMPQSVKNPEVVKNYADYWALTVSANSQNTIPAWNFIFYLVNSQQAKQYLASAGKAPALRVLISGMQKDEGVGVFAKQALSAKTWLQNNPENNSAVLKTMIESIVRGYLTLDNAINQAASQIK
ncbi:MAG: extracellular solute-binding protein [Patescibacteria group bacterium]|nr:extracellular solute-binding protein [Patescibacteria group bacterium]